jgi:hypothetical protein
MLGMIDDHYPPLFSLIKGSRKINKNKNKIGGTEAQNLSRLAHWSQKD